MAALCHYCMLSGSVCEEAAFQGHLSCLQFAHQQQYPWDGDTCSSAASAGELACLSWAHENGCPWSKETCENAAWAGETACLAYAHEHGCPWDAETMENAAKGGHMDCLKFAVRHGCPISSWASEYAGYHGHVSCMRFILAHASAWQPKFAYEDLCKCDILHNFDDVQWILDLAVVEGLDWPKLRSKLSECHHLREKAALRIQKAWYNCWYDPDMRMCHKRLSQHRWESRLLGHATIG